MNIVGVALKATRHHWRTHLPALAFVALATAIVTGALGVQSSIHAHLRNALIKPLGKVEDAFAFDGTFIAYTNRKDQAVALALKSIASDETAMRTTPVTVWGLGPDASKFWGDLQPTPAGQAMISLAVANDLGLHAGSRFFLRVSSPNATPASSVFGRRLASQSTVEVSVEVAGILDPARFGGFSLVPNLGQQRLVAVDREWIAKQVKVPGQANVILQAHQPEVSSVVQTASPPIEGPSLNDLALEGLTFTPLKDRTGFVIRSNRTLLSSYEMAACKRTATKLVVFATPSLVALAEDVSVGSRHIPYAIVASLGRSSEFRMNEWAATDLRAPVGSHVSATLIVPKQDGSFGRKTVEGRLSEILPMSGHGDLPELVPILAGMTDSDKVSDWSTPFPIDLSRITARDEAYWKEYRAAPKLYLDYDALLAAWGGKEAVTAMLISGTSIENFRNELRGQLSGPDSGISTIHVRANAEKAAIGSSDVAGLVLGLSSILIVAAFALSASLMLLNFQSRSRELTLMSWVGIPRRTIISLLASEALVVGILGAALGTPAGSILARVSLSMFDHWMPASASLGPIEVVVSSQDALIGGVVGVLCAMGSVLLFVRPLFTSRGVTRPTAKRSLGNPVQSGAGLILRSFRQRPMRLLSVAMVVAAGTAVLAVAAGSISGADKTGTGGIALQVETALPVTIDWTTPEGRKTLRFQLSDESAFEGVSAFALLRSNGSDASCLNPAKPVVPCLAGVDLDFIAKPPFPAATRNLGNAFALLRSTAQPPALKFRAVGDADTIEWILGTSVGHTYNLDNGRGDPAELNIVGSTHGTFIAGYLIVSRDTINRLYPGIEGPTLFLVKAPSANVVKLREALVRNLADYGATVKYPEAIVAEIHGVMNAYLSIFVVFGSLGMILGVCGSALAAARNVLDRRSEFALMLAVGIPRNTVAYWMVAETHLGVILGAVAGLVLALFVGLVERSSVSLGGLGLATLTIVLTSSVACVCVSASFLRKGVMGALRSE